MSGKRMRLWRHRRAMGMSQEQLAASIGMGTDRSTIYRWESGEVTPSPRKQPRLARALGVSATELIDLLTPEADPEEPLSRGRVGHALRSPNSTDLATVESLWQEVHRLDERYDRMPSTSLLAGTGQALGQIGFLARNGGDGALQRDLFAAEATAATLMGQLVWDASQRRDHRTARQYFDQATAAAREIGSPTAEGHALLRTSYLALYGERDPIEGLRLTEQTAEVTRSTSNVLTGLAQLHSAEAHAMLGDTRRCESALAAAECSFTSVRPPTALCICFPRPSLTGWPAPATCF
ncbi:helix-turn-helix transcriptional regulator [Haloechinothrix salitolerans]|uniref:Helix-turn-helix domain-containing protein n=1 Tax=Haloechinothrix salitolerans TaxID=926830 RepID=A0ABW2BVT9_9PSEU